MKLKNWIVTILAVQMMLCIGIPGRELQAADPPPVAEDFSNVVWLHADVSTWSQTATLRSVRVTPSSITLDYDKADIWPGKAIGGAMLNANPWIFVYRNDKWYAATWEWIRVGGTTKGLYAVNGDHIKREPLTDFHPITGELYGFMVSGLARDASRNVLERSNIVFFHWAVPSFNLAGPPPVAQPSLPVISNVIKNLLLVNRGE